MYLRIGIVRELLPVLAVRLLGSVREVVMEISDVDQGSFVHVCARASSGCARCREGGDAMTKQRDFKKLVRARMARTGERYAAARAQLADRPDERSAKRGPAGRDRAGAHPETAALARVLAAAGVRGFDGGLADEALLLGLGGGIGAACFVFEYKGHIPTLYVATRCQPQYAYDAEFIRRAATRVGAAFAISETTSPVVALRKLREQLERGPAITWLERGSLPWALKLRTDELGAMPHVVVVEGIDGERARIRDTPGAELGLDLADLAKARKRLRVGKHRLLSITGAAPGAPRVAIVDAIRECAGELGGRTKVRGPMAKNFGIAGLRRWAAALTAPKDPKRWTKVFPPVHAAEALAWGRYWIEHAGTGGGGFRPLYGDFLDAAAAVAKLPALRRVATQYRGLGRQWSALADAMLPDASAPLAAIRRGQDAHRAAFVRGDLDAMRAAGERLQALLAAARAEPPLDADRLRDHYADLARHVTALADDEEAAASALAAAID